MKEKKKDTNFIHYTRGRRQSLKSQLAELFRYRELLYVFAWRDIRLKYRQTVLGFAWMLLQPLLLMLIFASIFSGRFAQDEGIAHYAVFVFSGLLIYHTFSGAVSSAGNSLLYQSHIIKKNYFPRILLPGSSVITAMVDFLASLVILLALLIIMGQDIHPARFFLFSIGAMALTMMPILGFGVLFAALNVRYRDISFIIPFFMMIMLFVSPVIYPATIDSNNIFRLIILINPLSAPVELMKTGVMPNHETVREIFYLSPACSLLVLITGILTFNKMQKNIADII